MNQYDKYIQSDYIPAPFEQYMQAGNMQQTQYNQLRDQMQQQEDALAAFKVRMVDEPSKQEFMRNIQEKALDLYNKNKYYSPEMYSEVRSFMRRAAQDPKINAWSTALKNEIDFKDIEKRIKAAGQEPLYTQRHAVETPVYDNQGNVIYNPESTDLGIEAKLDWLGSGSKTVNDKIKPWLQSYGLQTRTITRKGGDGKDYQQTVIVDGQGEILDKNEPRVKKALTEISRAWENESTEGRQWRRFNPDKNTEDFLGDLIAEQRNVKETYKPLGGSQYEKWLNSFGGGEQKPDMPIDKYNSAILGLNTPTVSSKSVNFPERSEEYTPSKPELQIINKKASEAYNEYYAAYSAYKKGNRLSANDASILKKYTGMSNAELINNKDEIPFLRLNHFNELYKKEHALKQNPQLATSYNQNQWNIDDDIKQEANQHLGSIPISKTIIFGGEGLQTTLQALMQDDDGEAPLSNVVTDLKVVGGTSVADPEHNNFRKPHMKVEGVVNLETFKSLNFTAKKQVQSMATNSAEDAKKTGGYKIEMAIPSNMFSNENSALNVGQKVMGKDKGYQPEYFRNSTQQYNQLHNDAVNRWDEISTNYPDGLEFEPGALIKANPNSGNYEIIQNGKVTMTITPYDYEKIIKNKQ